MADSDGFSVFSLCEGNEFMLRKFFPFVDWLKDSNVSTLKQDLVAGLTVALVLIPQSMAYAQLAGMPVQYGLYAAFLPSLLGGLVRIEPAACNRTGGDCIPYDFSSPVTPCHCRKRGFYSLRHPACAYRRSFPACTGNSAAGTGSQFSFPSGGKRIHQRGRNHHCYFPALEDVQRQCGDAEHHYETIYRVIKAALVHTHWPTLALGVAAFVIMYGLRWIDRRIPYVLVAVVVTTLISWAIGYEHNVRVPVDMIASSDCRDTIAAFNAAAKESKALAATRAEFTPRLTEAEEKYGTHSKEALAIKHECDMVDLRLSELKEIMARRRSRIRGYLFTAATDADGKKIYLPSSELDETFKGRRFDLERKGRQLCAR